MLTRIENNGIVDTHQESIELFDGLELWTDSVAVVALAQIVVEAPARVVAVMQVVAP